MKKYYNIIIFLIYKITKLVKIGFNIRINILYNL